jgi:hypothetical protein
LKKRKRVETMLKHRINKLQKEVFQRYPQHSRKGNKKPYKYNLDNWTDEEIRAAVFPKERGLFDPVDAKIINKWEETDWGNSLFLSRLSVEELKTLESWLEQQQKEG